MSTLETLQALIQKKYGLDPATLDANASIRGHGLDSLAMVEFLFEIEDHFGLSLSDRFNGIDTLADFAAALDVALQERETKAAQASASQAA